MGLWVVTLLQEYSYRVEAESDEEAIMKAESGEFIEEEFHETNQVMSAEEL